MCCFFVGATKIRLKLSFQKLHKFALHQLQKLIADYEKLERVKHINHGSLKANELNEKTRETFFETSVLYVA